MRNLKRALSLALAAVMLLGMMVIGAGAAYEDFTDKDEIQHPEAVKTLTTLNVIAGKGDGSYYDPTGSLTRAEMAKLAVYILHGGKEPVLGTKAVPTYSDIKGTWAEAYIEYCSSMGIIAGDGAGRFNPTGTLTGSQAAKMLLVAMNYDAKVFGFTGNNWEINVNREANQAGLYDGLDGLNPSAVISRDDAAQMVYNAILAGTMDKSWTQDMNDGTVSQHYELNKSATLFKDKFNGTIYEGVLTATGEYDLTSLLGAAGSSGNRDGFVIDVKKIDDKTPASGSARNTYFKYKDMDLTALMGQYVKVLYNGKTEAIYGVYTVSGKNTVINTNTASVSYPSDQPNKVKIDGTIYSLESTVSYVRGESASNRDATCNNANAGRIRSDKVVFVDNDGNGKFDMALVTPVNVAEVTFLSTTNVTLANQSTDAAVNTLKSYSQRLEDVLYPEDLAKGNYVITTRDFYTDKDKLEIAEKQTGKISGVKGTPTITDYQMDDAWYAVATGYTMPTTIKSGSTMDYVAVNGVLYYGKLTSAATGSKDLAVIYDLSYGAAGTFDANTLSAKIILADGTKKTVTVGKLLSDINGTNYADKDGSLDDAEKAFKAQLVTYRVNNDGDYEFTLLTSNNMAGYDSFNYSAAISANSKDNTIGGTVVADDAVIVLYAAAASSVKAPITSSGISGAAAANNSDPATAVKVISGKEFKSISNGSNALFETGNASAVIGRDADGFNRVRMAMVAAVAASGSGHAYDTDAGVNDWTLGVFTGSSYGYLTTDSWTETVDDTEYNVYRFWNGSENVTMREKNSTYTRLPARTVIAYDVVDGETIKNVTASYNAGAGSFGGANFTNSTNGGFVVGAVEAYSSSANRVTLDIGGDKTQAREFNITNKTVVINVNDADKAGTPGNAISLARSIGDPVISYVPNAYFRVSGDEVQVIVIDVTKNQVAVDVPVVLASPSASDVNSALATGKSVSVSGGLNASANIDIPASATLTVTGNVTGAGKFTGGGTLSVTGTIADTASVATAASLTTNTMLPAPAVVIGTVGGDIGSGSTLYGANDLNGKALYQLTVPNWQSGCKLVSADGTPVGTAIANATDLYCKIASGQTRTIVIDPDGTGTTGNYVTYTITAPNF